MLTSALFVDTDCYFSSIIFVIKNIEIEDWETFYAWMILNFWDILIYANYFIYGVVWDNKQDMGIAIGYLT